MPLDGSMTETKVTLRDAMFEVRPPNVRTQKFASMNTPVKSFHSKIIRKEMMALVRLCSDYRRLMAQNAHLVPVWTHCAQQLPVNEVVYFSPHGFMDYYITEALGTYRGCKQFLEESALICLGFIERQHRAIHKLRRRAYEQERELEVLLECDETGRTERHFGSLPHERRRKGLLSPA